MSDIKNYADGKPMDWKPSAGKSISGSVVGYEVSYSDGCPQLRCMIDENGRLMRLKLTGSSLLGVFRLMEPSAGEKIVVTCSNDFAGGLSFSVSRIDDATISTVQDVTIPTVPMEIVVNNTGVIREINTDFVR